MVLYCTVYTSSFKYPRVRMKAAAAGPGRSSWCARHCCLQLFFCDGSPL